MTRADIRIETAKRRAKAAEAALSKTYAAKRAALEVTTKKFPVRSDLHAHNRRMD